MVHSPPDNGQEIQLENDILLKDSDKEPMDIESMGEEPVNVEQASTKSTEFTTPDTNLRHNELTTEETNIGIISNGSNLSNTTSTQMTMTTKAMEKERGILLSNKVMDEKNRLLRNFEEKAEDLSPTSENDKSQVQKFDNSQNEETNHFKIDAENYHIDQSENDIGM